MYTYNYDFSSADGLLVGAFAIFGIALLFGLAISIFMIIVNWRIFTKGNKPGWASIIPIYNEIVLCQMVGVNPWWVLISLCAGIFSFIPIIGPLVALFVAIYFAILKSVSLARAFGKEDAFAIGLILLPIVFYPILAFGSSEFQGENPMDDFVFKKAHDVIDTEKQNNATKDVKYCSSCGAKMSKDAKFCPKCGNEIK